MIAYWLTLASIAVLLIMATNQIRPLEFHHAAAAWSGGLKFKDVIAAGTLSVAAVGAFSGVYFGWRQDRRDAAEAQLRVHELELKIAQLEAAQKKPN